MNNLPDAQEVNVLQNALMYSAINTTNTIIIPCGWYKRIVRENGKLHLLAVNLLAYIINLYMTDCVFDECHTHVIGFRFRFDDDILQLSYAQIAERFGCSKREATDAVVTLEKLGLIEREFRTICINGVNTSNVLFINLFPQQVFNLTREES